MKSKSDCPKYQNEGYGENLLMRSLIYTKDFE